MKRCHILISVFLMDGSTLSNKAIIQLLPSHKQACVSLAECTMASRHAALAIFMAVGISICTALPTQVMVGHEENIDMGRRCGSLLVLAHGGRWKRSYMMLRGASLVFAAAWVSLASRLRLDHWKNMTSMVMTMQWFLAHAQLDTHSAFLCARAGVWSSKMLRRRRKSTSR